MGLTRSYQTVALQEKLETRRFGALRASYPAILHQPAKFFDTKSQFTRFQNDSTYLGRALR